MLKILERLNEKRDREEERDALRQIEHLFNVDIKNGKSMYYVDQVRSQSLKTTTKSMMYWPLSTG